jgi:hypothetical protein
VSLLLSLLSFSAAQPKPVPVKASDIRAEMEALANDSMHGRGSMTKDEMKAGEYIASQFAKFHIAPSGDTVDGKKSYLETVPVMKQEFAAPPTLKAGDWTGTHGKEIAVTRAGAVSVSGPLQVLKSGDKVQPGAVVYLHLAAGDPRAQMMAPLQAGAVALIVADAEALRTRFQRAAAQVPGLPVRVGNAKTSATEPTIIYLNEAATKDFDQLKDGTKVEFSGELKPESPGKTWNVIGVLKGSDPKLKKEVILLTAHMDHLGTNPKLEGDQIFNGADDDASGCTAVLEMARVLGAGRKPKRTVYFVTFGSEEKGGYGNQYFLQNPPVPITDIVANLEFEMIGRSDSAVKPDELWLTGYDRSNLGPELAKHGAKIVADPHPTENFFMRSDNYALARQGVVAQTVSSFGLHKDYHQVSDELSKIDWDHMTYAIGSMVGPVKWLVNSDFKPAWSEGKKP